MPVVNTNSLGETILFKALLQLADKGQCPPELPGNLLQLCTEASERIRSFPSLHPEFTLHDERHCLRVVELMSRVLDTTLQHLNAIEIALLMLSAYFHDQGMVVDASESFRIQQSRDWKTHERDWTSDHPNLTELEAKLSDFYLLPEERKKIVVAISDLRAAMFTDYIRPRHGELARAFITKHYGNDHRLKIASRSLADLLGLICRSHTDSPEQIIEENGFRNDELVGTTKVNVALIAVVLRLSDILDFDRDRTPDSLFRAINFKSNVSLMEWEKHRSITGWEVSPNAIRFEAECSHPAYQRAIVQFLHWVDEELVAAHRWNRSLPATFTRYTLPLAAKVDSSRVRARLDPSTGRAAYKYLDLEFGLSRDEIVKLLMTDQLYSSRHLFVRELVQNGLDALRHKHAIYRSQNLEPKELSVSIKHYRNSEGYDVVACTDNGVGMTLDIVERFLTKAGRSYYRSPDFERERARFRDAGCDFDPCARFGIGFMSCFMFGDEITILTRRDNGAGVTKGEPLNIQITGLSGIIQVLPGEEDQPTGTTVEVRSSHKTLVTDEWSDPVRLVAIASGYVLASEYRVIAECLVPGISRKKIIEPQASSRLASLEKKGLKLTETFVEHLEDTDARLRGEIRVCVLVDENGSIVTSNAEGRIEQVKLEPNPKLCFIPWNAPKSLGDNTVDRATQICCDGILVSGEPGRESRERWLGSNNINFALGNAAFLIDVRGDIKPSLTPARTPPNALFDYDRSWRRLFSLVETAYSRLISRIAQRSIRQGDPRSFWAIVNAFNLRSDLLPLSTIWRDLPFPVLSKEGELEWRLASELGEFHIRFAKDADGRVVTKSTFADESSFYLPEPISSLCLRESDQIGTFESLFLAMSNLRHNGSDELVASPAEPVDGLTLMSTRFPDRFEWRQFIRFTGNLRDVVCVSSRLGGCANPDHPVSQFVQKLWDDERERSSPLDQLLASIVWSQYAVPLAASAENGTSRYRWQWRLGILYKAIDWSKVPRELQPPYLIYIPAIGVQSLTEALFNSWSTMSTHVEKDGTIDEDDD